MKKKRISNFSLLSMSIITSLLIIAIASAVKIKDEQNQHAEYAMESKIKYYAKRCYLEGNCQGEITLKDLYDKAYLEEIVNPLTKEILDESTTLSFFNNKIIINWKEKNVRE